MRYQGEQFSRNLMQIFYLIMTKAGLFDPSREYEHSLTKAMSQPNANFDFYLPRLAF